MLKRKLDKATFDKLSDELKAVYKADGDDYVLQAEAGDDDLGAGGKTALEKERKARKDAEAARKAAEEALEEAKDKASGADKDIDKNNAKWQRKLDDLMASAAADKAKSTAFITKLMADNVASDLAHKISKAPKVIEPHIRSRITVDFDGDEPVARILKDGKPSTMTVDDLSKEFVANADFKDIIVASKASGGATPPGSRQQVPATGAPDKPVMLGSMRGQDLKAHVEAVRASRNSQ